MNKLRQVLKEEAPELSESLERSWKIAVDEWLGALKPSMGSYNAYPHLHNLENYLEQALGGISLKAPNPSGDLSWAELYVLLSAVLLHDIGRGKGTGGEHSNKSGGIIADEYAHFCIPSRELAKCIGMIAAAHGRPLVRLAGKRPLPDAEPLPNVVIDPYGEIRQESLAALLRLVDHMDSAHTRVIPHYVVPNNELAILGQFRSVVLGVTVDHEAHMIKTVISREKFSEKNKPKAQYSVIHPYDKSCESDWIIVYANRGLPSEVRAHVKKGAAQRYHLSRGVLSTLEKEKESVETLRNKETESNSRKGHVPDWSEISKVIRTEAKHILIYEKKRHARGRGMSTYLLPRRILNDKTQPFVPEDWLVARRLFQVHPDRQPPPHALLAVVMGDVLANARELAANSAELAALGLPLAAWLIDCEDHLFNSWGEETYEPILTKRFLTRVAEGMWSLSVRVFGFALFSYLDLAAFLGESDVTRVRRGVRRIGIVTDRSQAVDGLQMQAMWVGGSDWKWNVSHPREHGQERCSFVSLNTVCEKIDVLGDPYDERV